MHTQHSLTGLFVALIVVYAVLLIILVVAYVRILHQAGYSGWWLLIGFVPIANIVMFFVFAFKTWPVRRELEQLRARAYSQYGPGPGYGGPPGPYGPPPYR